MDFHALHQIRIVDQDQINPFEWDDDGRDDRLPEPSGFLRDPLLVSPLGDDDYLLLEDSRLYYSLVDAGIQHLPVQICPPVQLAVQSAPIGLAHFGPEDLGRVAAKQPDRIELLTTVSRAHQSADHLLLEFRFAGGSTVFACLRNSSHAGCPAPLDNLFRAILDGGSYFPIPEDGDEEDLVSHVRSYSGTVVLPPFGVEDLRVAVQSGRLFPPGLIQVRAACRVLNIDFPLSVLADHSGLEEKQSFLADLIGLRARRRRIACFDGRVYMLNR